MANNGKFNFIIEKHNCESRLANFLSSPDDFNVGRTMVVWNDLIRLKVCMRKEFNIQYLCFIIQKGNKFRYLTNFQMQDLATNVGALALPELNVEQLDFFSS